MLIHHITIILIAYSVQAKEYIYSQAYSIPKNIRFDNDISDFILLGSDRMLMRADKIFTLLDRKKDNKSAIYRISTNGNRFYLGKQLSSYFIQGSNPTMMTFQTQIQPFSRVSYDQKGSYSQLMWIGIQRYILFGRAKDGNRMYIINNRQQKLQCYSFSQYDYSTPKIVVTGTFQFVFPFLYGIVFSSSCVQQSLFGIFIDNMDRQYLSSCQKKQEYSTEPYNAQLIRNSSKSYYLFVKEDQKTYDYTLKAVMSPFDPSGPGLGCFDEDQTYEFVNGNQLIINSFTESDLLQVKRAINEDDLIQSAIPIIGLVNWYYSNYTFKKFQPKLLRFDMKEKIAQEYFPANILYMAKLEQNAKYLLATRDKIYIFDDSNMRLSPFYEDYKVNTDTVIYSHKYVYFIFFQKNSGSYFLMVSSTTKGEQTANQQIIYNADQIERFRINQANNDYQQNIMVVIKLIYGRVINQLWCYKDKKLVLLGERYNIIRLDYVAQQYLSSTLDTVFLQVEKQQNKPILAAYFATISSVRVPLVLPQTFWTFKLVNYYLFIFTTDSKCLIYEIKTEDTQRMFHLKATLYLPELNDKNSNIRIITDYDVYNELYGYNHFIYIVKSDETMLIYKTIDPVKNITIDQCCQFDQNKKKEFLYQPVIKDGLRKRVVFVDKYRQLKIINFDNPYKMQYIVHRLPIQLQNSKILDIHFQATQTIAPVLIKYLKGNKYYLSKINFNDLKDNKDFQWTYQSLNQISKEDITSYSDIIMKQQVNNGSFIMQFHSNNNIRTIMRLNENSLVFPSNNGRFMMVVYQQQANLFSLAIKNCLNQSFVTLIKGVKFDICSVDDSGTYFACSNKGDLIIYKIEQYLVYQKQNIGQIIELRFIGQTYVLIVTKVAVIIVNISNQSDVKEIIIREKQQISKFIYGFEKQIFTYSLDGFQVFFVNFNGTKQGGFKYSFGFSKMGVDTDKNIYLTNGTHFIKYSLGQCSKLQQYSNGHCICKQSMIRNEKQQCQCPSGLYMDNLQCSQCSFICSECEGSSTGCTSLNILTVSLMIVGSILAMVLIIFTILKLRRRHKLHKQSLLSEETLNKFGSKIMDE